MLINPLLTTYLKMGRSLSREPGSRIFNKAIFVASQFESDLANKSQPLMRQQDSRTRRDTTVRVDLSASSHIPFLISETSSPDCVARAHRPPKSTSAQRTTCTASAMPGHYWCTGLQPPSHTATGEAFRNANRTAVSCDRRCGARVARQSKPEVKSRSPALIPPIRCRRGARERSSSPGAPPEPRPSDHFSIPEGRVSSADRPLPRAQPTQATAVHFRSSPCARRSGPRRFVSTFFNNSRC